MNLESVCEYCACGCASTADVRMLEFDKDLGLACTANSTCSSAVDGRKAVPSFENC